MHYLKKVMRLKEGGIFHIFNESGEYEMEAFSKELGVKVRGSIQKPMIKALAFGLIKPHRLSFLIEKSVELGATHFFPLVTEHCQFSAFKKERYEKIIIEAVEQCGRLDLPVCYEAQPLNVFLKNPPLDTSWFFGDFDGDILSIKGNYGIIIGPEGGFSKNEILALKEHYKGIYLHKNVLRAETAAIVGLSF